MLNLKVSSRYSKALLELSQERGLLEESCRDLQLLLSVCKQNKDLSRMLKNPLIHADRKLSVMRKIFDTKIGKLSMDFIGIVIKKRREFFMEEIAQTFIEQYKVFKGITSAIVVSAVGLDDTLRKEITRIIKDLAKSEVSLDEKVDPKLIGGFIFRYSDMQYDSSVARSLNLLRVNFNKNLYHSKITKK